MFYRIELTPDDNNTFLVTFPDLPEVTSFGADEAQCLAMGAKAVNEALAARLASLADIPKPVDSDGLAVPVDPLLTAKIQLLWAMQAAGKSRADLMRDMGVHRPQVDRLFNPHHASRLDQLEAAFRALGKHMEITVKPLAAA